MEGTTEKLKTIVELIIKQRFKVNGDIFKYDFLRIKDEINTLADSDKYGISPIEQRELLKELDEGENEFFEIDYVNKLFTHSWGQQVVRFYDPDGNLIEVGTPVN